MSQLKFYKSAAIGFFILNIAVLGFFFFMRPKPPGLGGGQGTARDVLHFDDAQDEAFLKLADQHISEMREMNGQQKKLLEAYFQPLLGIKKSPPNDSLLHQINTLEKQKIESTYQHFEDVREILNPEQEVYFKDFVKGALGRILLRKNNQPGRPRK